MTDPLEQLSPEAHHRLRRCAQPAWVAPMLATLTHEPFSHPEWIFERKLDGERILAIRKHGKVRLLTRNRKEADATYPEIVRALEAQDGPNFILDGEVVAFEGQVTSFQRLQGRMKRTDPQAARDSGIAVYYYLFDVLHWGRYDTTAVGLRQRKRILKAGLTFEDPLRYLPHRNERGEACFDQACRTGWEGILAKKAGSGYAHGRSSNWLKFKCVNTQEFVIGGYTEPQGQRVGFGALLVGYYRDGRLRYAGKVGTGFSRQTLRDLHGLMTRLEVDEPPFVDDDLPRKGIHWIKPRLVGQFGFSEITAGRRLRHPRFLGLRRDKPPTRVHLEEGTG
jgi:DNA ligase D-like protein (predicted ligase)